MGLENRTVFDAGKDTVTSRRDLAEAGVRVLAAAPASRALLGRGVAGGVPLL